MIVWMIPQTSRKGKDRGEIRPKMCLNEKISHLSRTLLATCKQKLHTITFQDCASGFGSYLLPLLMIKVHF